MKIDKMIKSIPIALPFTIAVFLTLGLMVNLVWATGQSLKVSAIEKIGKEFMFDTLEWDKDRMEIKVVYEGKQILLPREIVTLECK